MFQPNNLEYLAAERQAELVRVALQAHLVASLRPPHRSWRQRVGRGLQVVGRRTAAWGERLADAQANCEAAQRVSAPVRTR